LFAGRVSGFVVRERGTGGRTDSSEGAGLLKNVAIPKRRAKIKRRGKNQKWTAKKKNATRIEKRNRNQAIKRESIRVSEIKASPGSARSGRRRKILIKIRVH
jgi:hypothetical protein